MGIVVQKSAWMEGGIKALEGENRQSTVLCNYPAQEVVPWAT